VRVLSKAIFVTVKLVFVDDMQNPSERVSISISTSVHRLSQVFLRLEVKSTPFIVTETLKARYIAGPRSGSSISLIAFTNGSQGGIAT
jgi:hypothetical protein